MNYLDSKSNTPKYWQLAERFRKQLKNGALKPGDRLPTLNEMRDDHKISRTTVEKAYGLLERDGLIERLHGSGVFVSQPRKGSTQGIIGLSGAGFNFSDYSPYWARLLGGAREAAAREKMQLLILEADSALGWEKADGVLVCDWHTLRIPRNHIADLPVVSLMTPVEGMASVIADEENGALIATRHLLQLGHRRIAFLHGEKDSLTPERRLQGYRQALQEADIYPHRNWTCSLRGIYKVGARFTIEAQRIMAQWLAEGWNSLGCTAILCHNDEAALGVMQALGEVGMRVPDDVSVMGFDGTEFCDLVSPRLSSVEVPLREIGARGVELLLKQIEADEVSDEQRVLPTQLRERESTAAPSHNSENFI